MLSSCHCWTVWCSAQQRMMVDVVAMDEEMMQGQGLGQGHKR